MASFMLDCQSVLRCCQSVAAHRVTFESRFQGNRFQGSLDCSATNAVSLCGGKASIRLTSDNADTVAMFAHHQLCTVRSCKLVINESAEISCRVTLSFKRTVCRHCTADILLTMLQKAHFSLCYWQDSSFFLLSTSAVLVEHRGIQQERWRYSTRRKKSLGNTLVFNKNAEGNQPSKKELNKKAVLLHAGFMYGPWNKGCWIRMQKSSSIELGFRARV